MSWPRYRCSDFLPCSTANKAAGAIKTPSKRGTLGQSWWAQRWTAVLERVNRGAAEEVFWPSPPSTVETHAAPSRIITSPARPSNAPRP